jgi:hypothetical protein
VRVGAPSSRSSSAASWPAPPPRPAIQTKSGLLHGVLTWAAGIVAILGFALLGAGALRGNVATAASQLGGLQQQAGQAGQAASQVDPAQVLEAAQQGAGWAALALGLTVLAAAAGGLVGRGIGSSKR